MTTTGRRRNERSRLAILQATNALITQSGYTRLTIENVAAQAGVGKQTIYRWWPSKGALVFDALFLEQSSDTTVQLPHSDDLATDLRELLMGTAEDLNNSARNATYRAVLAEIQHDETLGEQLLERLLEPLFTATRERLERARAVGEIDADVDLDVAVELLYGPLFHAWIFRRHPLTASHARTTADLVMRALKSPNPA